MKKRLFICLMILLGLKGVNCYSQSYFINEDFKGRYFYLKEVDSRSIGGFTKLPKYDPKPSNVPYPIVDDNGLAFTSYRDSLINIKFYCSGITDGEDHTKYLELYSNKTGNLYFPESNVYDNLITDEELNKKRERKAAYHKIFSDIEKRYIDDSLAYNYAILNPCSQIDTSYDDFSREKKYNTANEIPMPPVKLNDYQPKPKFYNAMLSKSIGKGHIDYYLSLTSESPMLLGTKRGVIIILKNRKRINKPNALVETNVNERGDNGEHFIMSSFIRLMPQDISLLKASPIEEFELYGSEEYLNDYKVIYQMFSCLFKIK